MDHGMGNLLSVRHAFAFIGAKPTLCDQPEELHQASRIVLPGVGAFGECMNRLRKMNFVEALETAVLIEGKPVLGICLGMQVMADGSEEDPNTPGLGWLDAQVVRIHSDRENLRVPHVGWNDVQYPNEIPLFQGLPSDPDFYFVHSYWLQTNDESIVVATCDYGEALTAAVRKDNIFATQFHPEKSQDYGLKVLSNFLEWTP